jgi:integrase/recombinase XerD
VRGKADRREQLPLPVDVGEALAAYLQRGRPRCQDRHLFVRVKAPTAELTADGVSKVVPAACRRAGLPVIGARRLRRTNARATLRGGGSLAEVGEVLRQRSAFTQALYAKVDRAALDRVARPWPGARSGTPSDRRSRIT